MQGGLHTVQRSPRGYQRRVIEQLQQPATSCAKCGAGFEPGEPAWTLRPDGTISSVPRTLIAAARDRLWHTTCFLFRDD